MGPLIKIAIRNLREHKAKTLIIGIIISIGIFILILGNALLDSAALGVRKSFIENYTADIMVRAVSKTPAELTGMGGGPPGMSETRNVPYYSEVYEYLSNLEGVASAHSQVASFSTMDLGDEKGAFTLLFGIEPESYLNTFPDNIEITEGRFLQPGEAGLVIGQKILDEIKSELDIELKLGEILTLQGGFGGGGGFGIKLREVPLVGVFKFKTDNSSLENMSFIDVQTLRSMMGMTIGTSAVIEISAEDTALLGSGEDSMFSEEDMFGGDMFGDDMVDDAGTGADIDFENVLGDTSNREMLAQPDSGAWHYTLLRLENSNDVPKMIMEINNWFAENDIPAQAVDWKQASGALGSISSAFKIIFNWIVIIIAVVAVIIIMNTLVISVIERTSEIGTMRALGAQRKFVRKMFIAETMTISFVFGTIGLLLGLASIGFLNVAGLKSSNDIFKLIFGSSELYPVIGFGSIVFAYVIMLLIGVISSLYPVSVALKISPVKAISTE